MLSYGSTGTEVADLQGRLGFLGHHPGPVDGSYDEKLQHAVQEFQHDYGMTESGTADHHLVDYLRSLTDGHGYDEATAHAGGYAGHYAQKRHEKANPGPFGTAEPRPHEHTDAHHGQHHGAPAATEAPPVAFESHVVTGDTHGFHKDLNKALLALESRLQAISTEHGVAIVAACKAFRADYAEPRIEKIQKRLTGEDYFKYMARHFMDEAGTWITKNAMPTLLGPVWIAFSMTASRAVGNAVKNHLSAEDELLACLNKLESSVQTELTIVERDFIRDVKSALGPVYEQLKNNDHLSPEFSWIGQFSEVSTEEMDEGIRSTFGFETDPRVAEVTVYERLVVAFEEMALSAVENPPVLFPRRENPAETYFREREDTKTFADREARAKEAGAKAARDRAHKLGQ